MWFRLWVLTPTLLNRALLMQLAILTATRELSDTKSTAMFGELVIAQTFPIPKQLQLFSPKPKFSTSTFPLTQQHNDSEKESNCHRSAKKIRGVRKLSPIRGQKEADPSWIQIRWCHWLNFLQWSRKTKILVLPNEEIYIPLGLLVVGS